MATDPSSRPLTATEIEVLQSRLREAEDTLDAIRNGAVDALVVKASNEQQIFTLKSADHTYRVLIESMNQGALTIAEDGTILYCNKQFSRLVGRPLNHVMGSLIQSYLKPEDEYLIRSIIKRRKKVVKATALTLELASTSYKALMLSLTRLKSDENAYMCVVVTDVTGIKQAEAAKDEFISLASHQLRTPATGVKQYLGMLLEGYAGELSEDHRMFIKTAYDSNERQLNIISDILKTARIDSGVYTLQRSTENIAELVDKVLIDYQSIFRMRKQRVTQRIDPILEAQVDPVEISLVISNLVENASKYSPEDTTIEIKATKKAHKVILTVSDQGVGIAVTDRMRIFDKFTRVDNALSDTVNGNGLGLYWVKRIVTLHGGSIEVASRPGGGSSFIVSLPA
jgi:PAS domain S-box-containing protein